MQPIRYPETAEGMYAHLTAKLRDTVPDFERRLKAEIAVEVNRLKRQKNAIILGHNYMEPALYHSVPDYTGDSLGLCRIAARTNADIIVFCGVQFMAETAKILNPTKRVLIPSTRAGCSLAAGIRAQDVRDLRELYPNAPIVAYVNTYGDVKAEVDYVCTSGNASDMVRHLLAEGHRTIVFLPDEYLSKNTAHETGMSIVFPVRGEDGRLHAPAPPEDGRPLMIGWNARCEVHEKFSVEDIDNARRQFPDVVVLAHPECSPDVVAASDFSGSTSQMIHYVEKLDNKRYLLLTECSMGDNIAAENPRAEMLRMCSVRCPHMNQITLEQTLESLKQERYVVEVPDDIRIRATRALNRMLAIGGQKSPPSAVQPATI